VEIRRVADQLLGKAPKLIRNYIELRGIGVIDVHQLMGMRAVKKESQIDLVVHLEQWREDKFYDRFGLDEETVNILGVAVPTTTIPVRPGRNLATIIEVATMNNRHKKYGFNAAQTLADELERQVQGS
jgi:HPr kinase/phosphorylase